MGTNACNKYELSPAGDKILSCEIAEMCIMVMAEPKCTKYYSKAELAIYQEVNKTKSSAMHFVV